MSEINITSWKEWVDCEKPIEAFKQLECLGYPKSWRTLYRHCDKGTLAKNELGFYSKRMVKQYLKVQGILLDGEEDDDDHGPSVEQAVKKQRLENDRLEEQVLANRLKNQKTLGKLVSRDALHLELAGRTVALDTGFKQKIDLESLTIIAAVNGDTSRQVELVSMLHQIWDELLSEYNTTDEFEVLFEEDEDLDAA